MSCSRGTSNREKPCGFSQPLIYSNSHSTKKKAIPIAQKLTCSHLKSRVLTLLDGIHGSKETKRWNFMKLWHLISWNKLGTESLLHARLVKKFDMEYTWIAWISGKGNGHVGLAQKRLRDRSICRTQIKLPPQFSGHPYNDYRNRPYQALPATTRHRLQTHWPRHLHWKGHRSQTWRKKKGCLGANFTGLCQQDTGYMGNPHIHCCAIRLQSFSHIFPIQSIENEIQWDSPEAPWPPNEDTRVFF